MSRKWHAFSVEPYAAQHTLDMVTRWYASAKVSGVHAGQPFSAVYDFSGSFMSQVEAENHAQAEGERRARSLVEGATPSSPVYRTSAEAVPRLCAPPGECISAPRG